MLPMNENNSHMYVACLPIESGFKKSVYTQVPKRSRFMIKTLSNIREEVAEFKKQLLQKQEHLQFLAEHEKVMLEKTRKDI